jgi:PAS domain-containing protein
MVSFNHNEGSLLRRITELEAQIAALQAEEERTTIALAESSVGVFDWDLRRQTVFVSPILQDMLGYECGSLPEQLDQWIEHVHASDRFRVQKELREALLYGQEHCEGGRRSG